MTGKRIGVEIELLLLDHLTLDLADLATPLIKRIRDDSVIDHEVIESCIEIKTLPVRNAGEAGSEIFQKLKQIKAQCDALGIKLCALGVHPFSLKIPKTTDKPRYLDLERKYPYITHHQRTFSTHVHVSMESLEQSIRIMGELRFLLPIFMSLSASSPYWKGKSTGFVSFRQYLLQIGLNGGRPPDFRSAQEYKQYVDAAKSIGVIDSLKDIHWDLRPRPDLGTLEVRIMDATPSISSALALVNLIQCSILALKSSSLMELMPRYFRGRPPSWAEPLNFFQALLKGTDASYVLDASGTTAPLKEVAFSLVEALGLVARELGTANDLTRVRSLLENPYYEQMESILRSTGSPQSILRWASDILEGEIGHGPVRDQWIEF